MRWPLIATRSLNSLSASRHLHRGAYSLRSVHTTEGGQPQTSIMAPWEPPGTYPEGCCGGRMAGECVMWPACVYIPGPEGNKWLLEMAPIGCDDTSIPIQPTATPLRETLLDPGKSSDVEAPAQSAGAFSRLEERLERIEKRQQAQAHRGRVYFTYAFLTLIAIFYKLQDPGRYAVYSVFSLYVALILYMAIKRNSERAIQGVWMWIGYIFLISALIAFVLMVIIPIFTKTGEFFSLGSQSQAAPVAAPPPPPPQ